MKTGVVIEFKGEHAFLSNFYGTTFKWREKTFFCGEQAFQYAKTFFPMAGEARKCKDLGMRLLDTGNPTTAKRYGREVPLDVAEWDKRRVQYMREIVHARFAQNMSDEDLTGQLINTGAMMLVEGNDWNDTFWGRCNGKGFNTLGVLLMEERGYWLKHEFKPAWKD